MGKAKITGISILLLCCLFVSCTFNGSPADHRLPQADETEAPRESESPEEKPLQLSKILKGEWVMFSKDIMADYHYVMMTLSFHDSNSGKFHTMSYSHEYYGPSSSVTEFEYEIQGNIVHIYDEEVDWADYRATIIDKDTIYMKDESGESEFDSIILERCYITPSDEKRNIPPLAGAWTTFEDAEHTLTFHRGGKLEIGEIDASTGYGLASYRLERNKLKIEESYQDELLEMFYFTGMGEMGELDAICQPEIFLYSPSVLVLEWTQDDMEYHSSLYKMDSEYINENFHEPVNEDDTDLGQDQRDNSDRGKGGFRNIFDRFMLDHTSDQPVKPSSNIAYYDGRIYYIPLNEQGIFSMNMEGGDRKSITSVDAAQLFVYDGYIYYTTYESDSGKLYRIMLDGTGEELVIEDNISYMAVYDGWIYYLNYIDYDHLRFVRYSIDDSVHEIIYDHSIQLYVEYYIYNDAIYLYSNHDSPDTGIAEGITKINTKNLNDREVVYPYSDIVFRDISFADDWMYYTIQHSTSSWEYESIILRCDYEFENFEPVKNMTTDIYNLHIWNDKLAFTDRSGEIYLMDIASGDVTQIMSTGVSSGASIFGIIGDWLFYGLYSHGVDEPDVGFETLYGLNLKTEELIDLN